MARAGWRFWLETVALLVLIAGVGVLAYRDSASCRSTDPGGYAR